MLMPWPAASIVKLYVVFDSAWRNSTAESGLELDGSIAFGLDKESAVLHVEAERGIGLDGVGVFPGERFKLGGGGSGGLGGRWGLGLARRERGKRKCGEQQDEGEDGGSDAKTGTGQRENLLGASGKTHRETDRINILRDGAEEPIKQAGEQGGRREGEEPASQDVAHGAEVQAAAVGHHGAGHAGAENMRRAHRQAPGVGGEDGGHGHQLGAGALRIGQRCCLPIRSPTVTTMRFQPTMVPKPRARATATLTQSGMNLVALSTLLL